MSDRDKKRKLPAEESELERVSVINVTTATNDSYLRKRKALQLCLVHHKHAARLARILQMAAKEIRAIDATSHTESTAIAGADYEDAHTVTFEHHPSISEQLDNDLCEVLGAGIDDVCAYTHVLLQDATKAAAVGPSLLLMRCPLPARLFNA